MSQPETLKYDHLLQECDLLIKAGKINSVVSLISKINLTKIPRNYRQSMAKLFRRAGLVNHGIRLLHPIIRGDKQLIEAPTPSEICEYSALISRIGSIKESLELLKDVNPVTNPEALLYSGFSHVLNWNYIEARKYFEQYLTLEIDNYSRLIAKVNLSACYVGSGDQVSAKVSIDETLQLAREAKSTRLQGNCLELRGQMNVLSFNFPEAKKDLKLAEEIFTSSQSYDALLTGKWQSIIAAFEMKSVEPILSFRTSAEKQKHWESVRESDLFCLMISFDQRMFDQLIFGTPSNAYQKRACELIRHEASEKLIWGDPAAGCIDLADCESESSAGLSAGKKLPQMLLALLKDLYAPRSVAALFSEVYSDEFFDIDSSPYRIRQIIKRLRHWLEENSYNVEIKYEPGGYRLLAKEGFSLLLRKDQTSASISVEILLLSKLRTAFSGKGFCMAEACNVLNISESGFHRFVRLWLQKGLIEKSGKARSTFYRIRQSSL